MTQQETQELQDLYEAFQKEFPIEKLKDLTLEQYTNSNKNSFSYWVETKTRPLGGINGGTSYKFGIYKFKVDPPDQNEHHKKDNEYAWESKYGQDRDTAFSSIKQLIIQIAESANNGEYEKIDNIDLIPTYKWKIAYLYSNKELISLYSQDALKIIANSYGLQVDEKTTISQIQRLLINKKGERNVFEYSKELWNKAYLMMNQTITCWIFSPGEKAEEWKNFYDNGIMAIGWDKIGDIKSKSVQEIDILLKKEMPKENIKDKKPTAKSLYEMCNTIKVGDTIIAKKGSTHIVGIGTVVSDYYYADSQYYSHRRKVKWWKKGDWQLPKGMTTFKIGTLIELKDKNKIHDIMATINATNSEINNLIKNNKQIILQGAPGTGKTYATAELAVSICNPSFITNDRKELMKEYNRLRNEGYINFTTFHQSMDYEEFVEGYKPLKDSGQMQFEAGNGIFKDISNKALLENISFSKINQKVLEFDDMFDTLIDDINSGSVKELALKQNGSITLMTSSFGNIYFRFTGTGYAKKYTVSKNRLRKLYSHFDTKEKFDSIKNINDEIREVVKGCATSGYWAVLNYILTQNVAVNANEESPIDVTNLSQQEQNSLIQNYLTTPIDQRANSSEPNNYVLIIDEINRGNISKILGELITLLEKDKRVGEINELTVELPYSHEIFGVPSNLFIIGTMNTADRSVGYIDYAIRRRFSFFTLKSDIDKVKNYYTINKDIINDENVEKKAVEYYESVESLMKVTSDFNKDDMMIGHSYFMANSIEELSSKMKYEVKPLLLEYYNDGILSFGKDSDEYKKINSLGD
jgi:5-methylcytosine-specific restriction endonuclease McrBC GTP-binding regulatory subunit McrB